MTNAQIKAKKFAENYSLYLLSCSKIKNSNKFSLKTLQRVLRPSCKTILLNNSILSFKLKQSKTGVSIILSNESFNTGIYYLTVKSSKNPSIEYMLSASNIKELMFKINNYYQLLAS